MAHPAHLGSSPRPRRAGDVRTHYNLNTGGYTVDRHLSGTPARSCRGARASVGSAGRGARWVCTEDTVPSLLLLNAYFSFARAGHRAYVDSFSEVGTDAQGRPVRMGKRNVHAHVFGTLSERAIDLNDGTWRPARYSANPACFVDLLTVECLPNDGSVDVYLGSTPNSAGRRVYRSKRKPPKSLPTMWWRFAR